ncbi:hypothetical protein GF360_02705 [candidate division WWE3 bacterium]|nr:hypothetical protein [candidate division WWE3 bacterium]
MLPKILFSLWFLSLNLGQFSALSKGTFGGIYLFDLFAVLWVFGGFLYFFMVKRLKFYVPKIFFPLLGFIFIAFVSLLAVLGKFSQLELLVSGFYLFRFIIYVLGGLLVYNFLHSGQFSEEFLFKLVAFSAVFISLAGFIQLVVLPDFTKLDSSLGWDPHKNRLASTFFDPNFVGAYLVLCFNILVSGKRFYKKFYVPLVLLTVFSIFLTFSRSAWLMLAISIFVWGVFRYRFLLFLAGVLAFSAYFAVPRVQTRISGITDPADSAHFRLISWQNTFEIASDNLFLGTGFNTFRFVQKDYGYFGVDWGGHSGGGSDSSLLLVLATTGVFGFLAFFGFWVVSGISGLQSIKSNPYSLVLLASLSSLLVESFFINSLFYPQILLFWLLIIVLYLNPSYK